jgi:hypothetical protein
MEMLSHYAPIGVLMALVAFILLPPLRYYRGEAPTWWRPTLRNIPAACAAGLASAVAAWGADQLMGRAPAIDRIDTIVADIRTTPLVGLLLEDVPDAEEELREALSRDLADGRSQDEINRTAFDFGRRLVAEHSRDALLAAGDELILEVWEASRELVLWLARSEAERCSEPLGQALADLKADETFLELTARNLSAMERAYLDGRGVPPRDLIELETLAALMIEHLGFTGREFDVLADPLSATAQEQCEVGLLVWTPLDRLPEALRAPYARYFLTVSE